MVHACLSLCRADCSTQSPIIKPSASIRNQAYSIRISWKRVLLSPGPAKLSLGVRSNIYYDCPLDIS
jgi:hypothetical protein